MNWAFVRREWGAVTFVLTVIVGMIIVPVALYFANQGPAAIIVPNTPTVVSPIASGTQTASPANLASPSPTSSP